MKTFLLVLLMILAAGVFTVQAATGMRISEYPAATTLATNDLFIIASGSGNKKVTFTLLSSKIGGTNGLMHLSDVSLGTPADKEVLTYDAAAGKWTNATPPISEIVTYNSFSVYTNNFHIGKGGHLTITQAVNFVWSTLTISGGAVSAVNLTNRSFFKLTLTENATMPAPTGLPGTNLAQSIQIHVQQDGTGGRTLAWNSAYKFPGGSAPTMTTTANAVDVFTFVSSPFDAAKLYGVQTADIK